MGISRENRKKNRIILAGVSKKKGFDMWRHSFTGYNKRTGESSSFFIELSIVNPALAPKSVIFTSKPSFVMIRVGMWGSDAKQLTSYYPFSSLSTNKKRLCLQTEDFYMTESELKGSITVTEKQISQFPNNYYSAGTISWNLKMDKRFPVKINQAGKKYRKYWFVQGMKTLYGGTILIDDDEYMINPQKSYGYSDKIWGKNMPNPFLWISSSNLISLLTTKTLQNSCFDVCGVFGQKKDKLQIIFNYQDTQYCFSNLGLFSKDNIKYEYTQTTDYGHWILTAQNKKFLLDLDVYGKKADMIFKKYLNSDGLISHRKLWSCGNGFGEIRLYKKVNKSLEMIEQARIENCGCEYGNF